MRSIDDTSNFDDFPDVEIGLGELGRAKNCKKEGGASILSIIINRSGGGNIFKKKHNMFLKFNSIEGVESVASQEEAKESKSKDWMFINYTFKRYFINYTNKKVFLRRPSS